MLVIPVLDVQNGSVVHGRFGRRDEYRPIESQLCAGSDALDLARAFRQHFDLTEIYLADLDAIMGGEPHVDLYRRLVEDGFKLWIDPGVRQYDEIADRLDMSLVHRLVIGSETLASISDLGRIVTNWGAERIIFSLDLREGKPITGMKEWIDQSPSLLMRDVQQAGVRNLLLLDLARVGSGQGIGTESLVQVAKEIDPTLAVFVGGGVSGAASLEAIKARGAEGVLVASALHDGRLSATDVQRAR